jgi:hypothetical protein
MSYSEDVGAVSARYRPGGAAASVTYPSGTHVRFTAPGSVTNGQYGLFEWNMTGTPGGADPHFHKTFSESFYITEGTVRLFDGETWVKRGGTGSNPVAPTRWSSRFGEAYFHVWVMTFPGAGEQAPCRGGHCGQAPRAW